MARQLIEKYVFTPGTANSGTLLVPGKVDLTQVLIIANKTNQVNMYAIGDPTKNGTAVYYPSDTTFTPQPSGYNYTMPSTTSEQVGTTLITFAADTSTFLSSDKIAVYTDAPKQLGNIIRPYAFGVDAIERMRVSEPQNMIDADFEYGLQPTKWLNYSDIRNLPAIFEKPGLDLFMTNITSDGGNPSIMTVTCSQAHGLSIGQPVIVFGLSNASNYARAEGSFVIQSVTSTTFTYYAKGIVGTNGTSAYQGSSYARRGGFYAGSLVPVSSIWSDGNSPSKITVNCTANHGMIPGTPIINTVNSAGTNHAYIGGNFYAESVPSATQFTFTSQVGGAVANSAISANIHVRSDAFVQHRPFDGGVNLGTFNASHGASISRQTKKYIRYQSGKGVLWTSGVLFNPVLNLDQISSTATAVGSTVTVTTEVDHGLQAGATVVIAGVTTSGYNGTYGVASVTSENTFTVLATSILGSATAVLTNLPRVTVVKWHGATTRCGTFDDQNGLFWEFDGNELAVVKRASTFQTSGFVSVTPGSQTVAGSSTRFTQQLKVGDMVIIRGQSYKINAIASDTSMTVNPPYRGVNASSLIKMSLTMDYRIPQKQFNIDRADGTGISGYNLNINKMQMLGISFSWYGAGFIDFMCRGGDGNMILVHRMPMNNINDEAYMRSGNMVARYQAINESVTDRLQANVSPSDTTISVNDVSRFPNTGGTVYIDNELINYTSASTGANTLLGCSRAATLSFFIGGTVKNFTAGAAANHYVGNGFNAVTLVSCTTSPVVNHWGSSYIMDGKFDTDRGYFFNYQQQISGLTAGSSQTAFFLRLAPSVSNSIAGQFGDRDLINRAQLLLTSLQIQSDQSVTVTGLLNPGNIDASSLTWTNVNTTAFGSQPSFAQISTSSNTAATPGEQIFGTLGQPGGFASIDLGNLKEIGNGAIGGYSNFPDGPDVLAVVVKNNGSSSANPVINLFWTEAQA
jgi:hypothetical protein